MTIKELKDWLSQYPEDAEIKFSNDDEMDLDDLAWNPPVKKGVHQGEGEWPGYATIYRPENTMEDE